MHGTYISPYTVKKLADHARSVHDATHQMTSVNVVHDAAVSAQLDSCKHPTDSHVFKECKEFAESIDMDPVAANYILTGIIPKLAADDEYVRKTLMELLVYAKVKESEAIDIHVQGVHKYAEDETTQNIKNAQSTINNLNKSFKSRIDDIQRILDNNVPRVTQDKEWLVNKVNRAIGVTGGNYDVMSETDRKIIEVLRDSQMLVIDGPYVLVNQQKLYFEMTEAEYNILATKLAFAVRSEIGF